MPNWCSNSLTITGLNTDIQRLQEEVKGKEVGDNTVFSLQSIVPMPAEISSAGDWYTWCSANWGTKWDVEAITVDEYTYKEYTTWSIDFDSAWSPPIEALATLAKNWPIVDIYLTYDEPGNDFAGQITWQEGVEVCHDQYASAWNEEADEWNEVPVTVENWYPENKCKRQ